jgi:hypothetical protein
LTLAEINVQAMAIAAAGQMLTTIMMVVVINPNTPTMIGNLSAPRMM